MEGTEGRHKLASQFQFEFIVSERTEYFSVSIFIVGTLWNWVPKAKMVPCVVFRGCGNGGAGNGMTVQWGFARQSRKNTMTRHNFPDNSVQIFSGS